MAINLNTSWELDDEDLDIKIPAFLLACKMPQIADPEWVDPLDGSSAPKVDEYSTTKEWAEAYLISLQKRVLLKRVNEGIDIGNRVSTQAHLTSL